jgi:DNA repair protein RadC
MSGNVVALRGGISPDVIVGFLPDGSPINVYLPPRNESGEPPRVSAALLDRAVCRLSAVLRNTVDRPQIVAAHLLGRFGSLSAVLASGAGQLTAVEGMNAAGAQLIRATYDLMIAARREECFGREPIPSPAALRAYLDAQLQSTAGEGIRGLFLDRADGLIDEVVLAPERPGRRVPCTRFVARHAVACGAAAVLLARTDPAAAPVAAPAEVESVKQMAAALGLLGIALHDHVIVGRLGTLSLRDQGHL